jgi:CRP-like cAMP-binding protein
MLTTLEKVDLLQKAALFQSIPTESLARVAAIAQEVNWNTRQFLFLEDDPPEAMFILLEGQVEILRTGQEGRKVGPNQVVGALALLADEPEPESAMADQPSRTLRIDQQDFYEALGEDFNITRGILRALVHLVAGGPESPPLPRP